MFLEVTRLLEDLAHKLDKKMSELLERIQNSQENNENPSKTSLLQKLTPFPEISAIMTYPEVIDYFVKNSPAQVKVTKKVVLKEKHPKGHIIIQVFLNEKDELVCQNGIPCGRRQIVKELDEELIECFADKSMIVFQ